MPERFIGSSTFILKKYTTVSGFCHQLTKTVIMLNSLVDGMKRTTVEGKCFFIMLLLRTMTNIRWSFPLKRSWNRLNVSYFPYSSVLIEFNAEARARCGDGASVDFCFRVGEAWKSFRLNKSNITLLSWCRIHRMHASYYWEKEQRCLSWRFCQDFVVSVTITALLEYWVQVRTWNMVK